MAEIYELANEPLLLAPGVVHVWRTTIEPARPTWRHAATLSADEHARAAQAFISSAIGKATRLRGTLHRLLASYVGMAAADLKFNYGPRGKPELDATSQDPAIQFNVSHRGALALYAFVLDRAVGIDIEYLREVPEALAIARNHFTATETRLLEHAAMIGEFVSDERPGERAAIERRGRECFFRLWTRKEAVIKAVGTGLSMPLDEFDVSSEAVDEGPWRTIHVPRADTVWAVRDLPIADNHRAAICLAGGPAEIQYWRTA